MYILDVKCIENSIFSGKVFSNIEDRNNLVVICKSSCFYSKFSLFMNVFLIFDIPVKNGMFGTVMKVLSGSPFDAARSKK